MPSSRSVAAERLGGEVLALVGDLLGALGERAGRELVRRLVGEVARAVRPARDATARSASRRRPSPTKHEPLERLPRSLGLPAPRVVGAEHEPVDDRARLLRPPTAAVVEQPRERPADARTSARRGGGADGVGVDLVAWPSRRRRRRPASRTSRARRRRPMPRAVLVGERAGQSPSSRGERRRRGHRRLAGRVRSGDLEDVASTAASGPSRSTCMAAADAIRTRKLFLRFTRLRADDTVGHERVTAAHRSRSSTAARTTVEDLISRIADLGARAPSAELRRARRGSSTRLERNRADRRAPVGALLRADRAPRLDLAADAEAAAFAAPGSATRAEGSDGAARRRQAAMAALSAGPSATDFANGALPALLPFLVERFDLSYTLAGWRPGPRLGARRRRSCSRSSASGPTGAAPSGCCRRRRRRRRRHGARRGRARRYSLVRAVRRRLGARRRPRTTPRARSSPPT